MKTKLLFATAVFALLTITSCKKAAIESESAPVKEDIVTGRTVEGGCTPTSVTLLAGQTINAGSVDVTNDSNFIYVTYTPANGWLLTQTHLYVGDCALIPVNNPGNPIPGQFPYNSTHSYVSTYTYQVPISTIGLGNCGCIAAHAVIVQLNASGQVIAQQTGWGNGTVINPGGNWGMKFDYCTCTPVSQ